MDRFLEWAVTEALNPSSNELSRSAEAFLNELPAAEVLPILEGTFFDLKLVSKEELLRRARAYSAIIGLRKADKIPFLVKVYDWSNEGLIGEDWQISACEALATVRDQRAIAKLIDAMQSNPDGSVRLIAARGLSIIGDESALAPLEQVFYHDDGEDWEGRSVADEAIKSLRAVYTRLLFGGLKCMTAG